MDKDSRRTSPEETSEPETPAPPGEGADNGAPPASASPAERRRWRRVVNRRNAMWTGSALVAGILSVLLVVFFMYRTGRIDNLIAHQIVGTLAQYGIRAEIKEFHTKFGPRTVEMQGLELYDAQTGERIGRVDNLLATIRIEDLYALNLRRNINLEKLVIDGLELWVAFDEQGRSNFRNLHLPPPAPNSRILFSYSTAQVELKNGVVHYGDERHEISGVARNIKATVQPDDLSAPAESRMNQIAVSLSDSTFAYDGRPINDIDIEARARVNQTRAEIESLVLRSPVAEAQLQGALDDWRALRYQLQVTSASVDLTNISETFQTGAALRGAGRFMGTVKGEGDQYQVEGQIISDALAADNIRLKNLNVTARAAGAGAAYEAQGSAVAELLTAGDFVLNLVQAQGGVKGTGTDFRFLGDLRAASARQGATNIAGLFIDDALAELRDGQLSGSAARATVSNVSNPSVKVNGAQVSGVRFSRQGESGFDAAVSSASTGAVQAEGARLDGVTAGGITATNRGGVTRVAVNNVRVAGGAAAGAQLGSINVAGVRLAIFESGRVEGTTGDVNVGTVTINNAQVGAGRIENVRLARPTFVVEPAGRYRASADLSLGGGVLGEIPLGAARAQVVATNSAIELNDFTAEAMNGSAQGDAVISTARGGAARVNASFSNLDVGKLLSLATGNSVPVAGAATGTINLSFPGTNVELASGTLNTQFTSETGSDVSGRTPVNGDLVVRASRGQFGVERANLRAGATELNATGQFSFAGDSNLQVKLASTDAAELQRIAVNSGLLGNVEETLEAYGIAIAGHLNFDGTVRGSLNAPSVDGRVSLGSLAANGRDLGALTASIQTTPTAVMIPDGRLVAAAANGGEIQFALNLPLDEANTGTIEATLERYDIGRLLAALPLSQSGVASGLAAVGPTSGRISVSGFPGAMSGSADLRAGPGQIGNEPFQEIAAKATFSGSTINLETLDARLRSGRVTATGTINVETTRLDLRASGTNVNLNLIETLAGRVSPAPALEGTFDFTADVSGAYADPRSLQINFNGAGQNVVVNGQQAGTLTLVGRTENSRLTVQLTTGLLGQPQVIAAQVDLSDENLPTTIETSLTKADLTQLFAALLPGANVRVTGTATGALKASGNLVNEEGELGIGALRGTAQFTDLTFQIEDVQLSAESPLLVQFSPEEIFFERTRFTGPGTNILFGGTAALGPGGRQNFTVDGDLNLRVLNGLSPDVFLAGMAQIGIRVGGTFADPSINGTLTLDDASFSTLISDERLQAQNIDGAIRFTADRAQIDSLTGTLGGGRVQITGGAAIDGFALGQFRLNVLADGVTVPFPDGFNSTVDANLEVLQGTQPAQLIRGTINARRVEYTEDIELADFVNRPPEAEITESVGGAFGGSVQLDLRVEGRDALVIRNNLADAVGSIALQIRGTAQEPQISGRITATRGTLTFRNDRYEITRALIDLPPRRDADPILNIQAESEIRGYNVIVTLTGPLSQPTALVRSDPALPQADVIALITTGNLATGDASASTLAQTGFGTATSLLTDTLINAPVQRATDRLFGLNRFELDPLLTGRGGSSPTARLTVGRQINRNLSLTYSTNLTTDRNQVVLLEYRVSDRLSFVARYEQAPVNAIRAQDDNFSVEVRFRKRF